MILTRRKTLLVRWALGLAIFINRIRRNQNNSPQKGKFWGKLGGIIGTSPLPSKPISTPRTNLNRKYRNISASQLAMGVSG